MNNLTLKFHISKLINNKPIFKFTILLISNYLITNNFLYSEPDSRNNLFNLKNHSDTTAPLPISTSNRWNSSFRGMDISSDSSIWISGSKGTIVRGSTKILQKIDPKKTALKMNNNPVDLSNSAINPSNAHNKFNKRTPINATKKTKTSANINQKPSTRNQNIYDVASYFQPVSPIRNSDFRDIVAWDSLTALTMSVGDSGRLLKTIDGGKSWNTVFQENSKGVFFDDLEFDATKTRGLLAGDPLNGRKNLYFRVSFDSGNTWEIMPQSNWNKITPRLSSMYAASGSSIKIIKFNRIPSTDSTQTENYHIELIIGGGGDSGACIRWANLKFERNWHNGNPYIHTYYQSFLDLPLYDSMQPGYGVYGLSALIHDENNFTVFAGGGHWKYPEREENNTRMLEFRKHKDSQSYQIWNSPFEGLAYNSGVVIGKIKPSGRNSSVNSDLNENKKISNDSQNQPLFDNSYQLITVGTNGIKIQKLWIDYTLFNAQTVSRIKNTQNKTPLKSASNSDEHRSNSIEPSLHIPEEIYPNFNIRLPDDVMKLSVPKNLNAIRFDGNNFWIAGSNGQIYCISGYSK